MNRGKDTELRLRAIRRERWREVRLVLVVVGILAVSVWWLVTNVRS